ncbi:MAG: NnrU family protein [Pseudomonadota bacterium]|nr:NnrU family protein [Pseudomonadota bacterium]
MPDITPLLLSAVAFVGTHFLLSHPLRGPMVNAVGERVFLIIYSLTAIGTLVWMVGAYRATPASAPLWPVGDALWILVTVIMLMASILFVGSLTRNPALPSAGAKMKAPETARGVFAVTRHPMMWGFALWGACHILVYPVAANIVLASAVIVLALVGATLQDRKKEKLQPLIWSAWEAKTSYWPFAAIIKGTAHLGQFGAHAIAGGLLIWLAATYAHRPFAGIAAGIWRWF